MTNIKCDLLSEIYM